MSTQAPEATKTGRRSSLAQVRAKADATLPYAVLEHLAEGLVLVDDTGRISEWNRAMEEITGVAHSEVLGRLVWDVYREHVISDDPQVVDIRALVKELIRQALRDPASPRLRARTESAWQRPDGERRVIRTDTFAVGWSNHCTLGYVAEDVTEDRRAESALRLTQLSVDAAADLIHWIAADGRLLYVSDSSCERHGYSREELLSMTIFDLDPLLTPKDWQELWQEMRDRGSLSFETIHRTKSGELFPIEVGCNYVLHDGCEYNFVYGRDISERKLAEQELQRAKESLETSNRELEAAMYLAEEATRGLQEMNKRLLQTQGALAHQARTDPLTGCLNRGAVLKRLEEELVRAERNKSSIGVGMIDIDHFKHVNDTYGHQVGDQVLCEVVARTQGALRPYDVFGRFGGEEFLVVVPDADPERVRDVLERIRSAIARDPVRANNRSIPVTVSAGGAARKRESADTLVDLADAALYRAKALGRDRVELSE